MTEKDYSELPTEILLQIFPYLPAKNMIHSRRVCKRWKSIVDWMNNDHSLWHNYCMKDFKHLFRQTENRMRRKLHCYHLYRSFSLWSKLDQSLLVQDEFAIAHGISDEIVSFVLLSDDVIGIHTESAIVYYNLQSLDRINCNKISGHYVKYDENNDVIVLLNHNLLLFVISKVVYNKNDETHVTFDNATNFLLLKDKVYFIKDNVDIFVCNSCDNLSCTYINKCNEDIESLGYKDDTLYFFTYEKNLYKVIGTNLVLVCSLKDSSILLDTMSKYNLLGQRIGFMYSQLMLSLSHIIPEGPLRALIVIHVYGDVIFIGTMWGILMVYYAPYTNGKLNFNNTEPIKQFNFMESEPSSMQSYCPIMQIEVIEGIDEHTVLVAMPKKIAVLKFIHRFKESSIALFSYYNYNGSS